MWIRKNLEKIKLIQANDGTINCSNCKAPVRPLRDDNIYCSNCRIVFKKNGELEFDAKICNECNNIIPEDDPPIMLFQNPIILLHTECFAELTENGQIKIG